MMNPKYTIIIPTLNEEKFLPFLLDSIAIQTAKNTEVIVVDGHSKDKTVAVAQSYHTKISRLRTVVCPEKGVSAQRNYGASLAKGDWLLFVDADSILLPYAIERMDAYIDVQKPKFFTTWFRPDTEETGDAMVALLLNASYEGARIVKRPFTQGTFAAVVKSVFLSVGGYDTTIEFGEDYDLTKRIYHEGVPLQVLRETLYVYSFRRFRHQGTLKSMQLGAWAAFSVLLSNKTPRRMPGYEMGGHPYVTKKKKRRIPKISEFNRKFRKIISEVFDY